MPRFRIFSNKWKKGPTNEESLKPEQKQKLNKYFGINTELPSSQFFT
jgi:hypothetical protein